MSVEIPDMHHKGEGLDNSAPSARPKPAGNSRDHISESAVEKMIEAQVPW